MELALLLNAVRIMLVMVFCDKNEHKHALLKADVFGCIYKLNISNGPRPTD